MMEKLSLDKFEEAYERVQEVVLPTNLVQSDFFSQMTGNKVYFKPENLQLTGAYKIRGAYYKISTLSDEEKAKDIAMHVAAINPKYISQDEIPQVEKDREDAVQTEIMANDPKLANKPEKVLEGIKRGKLNKVFSEWCLLDQEFIKTPKESVAKYLGKAKVLEMARFQVGEGMEKREENFAEEVAAQMKG